MSRKLLYMTMAAGALALAGCGGDDDSTPPTGEASGAVPQSASASTTAMVDYLQALSPDDTAEPLTVDTFAPPTPDDAEPQPLS